MKHERIQGLTILELLVGMLLLMIILGVVLTTTISTMGLYRKDQSRIGANRNSRSTLDIVNSDIRQAGERLNSDFPAIQISQDGSGNSVLTLRRGLLDSPLPVCAPLPNVLGIYVNANNPAAVPFTGGVSNLPAACSTGTQDLSAWIAQIAAGVVSGYVFDTADGRGSHVTLTGTSTSGALLKTQLMQFTGSVSAFDPVKINAAAPERDIRLYLIEERQYTVSGGKLMLGVNGKAALAATPRVVSFKTVPYLKGTPPAPPTLAALPFPGVDGTGKPKNWKNLAYLDLSMTVTEGSGTNTVQRTLTQRLTPRNTSSSE
jgi:type II secretory pathway pseudopilin PulG